VQNYGTNAIANAFATEVVSGGNTQITLADNTHITFLGVTALSQSQSTTT
jgi:hypothetical protein